MNRAINAAVAAVLLGASALPMPSANAFWGPFDFFDDGPGWGGGPWGGYPGYYGGPWGGYPGYYGGPWGGHPGYYGGPWGGYPGYTPYYGAPAYGWGAPYVAPAAPVTPSTGNQ